MSTLKLSLEHGWSFDNQPDLYEYDVMGNSQFGFARLWSGGMRTALSSREGIVHVVALVEGAAEMAVEGKPAAIEAGQILLVRGDAALEGVSSHPFARYGWFFSESFLEGREYRHLMGEPRSIPRESLLAMTSVANASLGAGAAAHMKPSIHTRIAMEHLVAAAAVEASVSARVDAVHRDRLFLTAQAVIAERFRDPGFTIDLLCKALSVSHSSLYRAHESMGSTPRRAIERLRVSEATSRLASIEQMNTKSLTEVASEAGFTSVVQMRRAFARAGIHQPQVRRRPPG
ncbi:AraC family transcriptional regulator [Microbacterium sp. LMI12-1-1.1]|uniref:AraC family transcriptional regulator n=1 Tax=Microbacterium sp. LMI12-1-1.1 TaxID=3135225 RepID=UPI003437DD00